MRLAIVWLTVLRRLTAHSWIDNLNQADNLTNTGFIRDYQGHLDAVSTFQINSKASTAQVCKPNQRTRTYSAKFPMLTLQAGKSFIANYSENGHVTKDALKPDGKPHPGNYTWFLQRAFEESMPSPLQTLGDLASATQIATGNYDDGLCAEDDTRGRAGPRQCQSRVTIPASLAAGTYQLVWLWEFPKVPGVVEMYSSCLDVHVLSSTPASDGSPREVPVVPVVVVPAPVPAATVQRAAIQQPAAAETSSLTEREQADLLIEALSSLLALARAREAALPVTSQALSTPVAQAGVLAQAPAAVQGFTTLTRAPTQRPANPLIDAF